MSTMPPDEPVRVPTFFQIVLALLHAVGMNFIFLLPILLLITPIVASMTLVATTFWLTTPMVSICAGLLGLGAVASAIRVWLRLMVN